MPKKRHSPEQIAAALRQAEARTPIAEITRKLGVHENKGCHSRQSGGSRIVIDPGRLEKSCAVRMFVLQPLRAA
jgi:hypothetical protein